MVHLNGAKFAKNDIRQRGGEEDVNQMLQLKMRKLSIKNISESAINIMTAEPISTPGHLIPKLMSVTTHFPIALRNKSEIRRD